MNRREFLATASNTALAAAAVTSTTPSLSAAEPDQNPPPNRKNWLWMDAGKRSPDDWRKLFAKIKQAGFDAVLPEVYNGTHAHFDHPHPAIESRGNTLEAMIPLAHDAGIEVHAWMWTVPCRNPQIVADHPNWYAVNGRGESAHEKPAYVSYYKFLCPRREESRKFITGNVEALARIEGLDGVHLDYVRLPDVILAKGLWAKYDIVQDREYPQYDYCYCEECRRLFKQQTGVDPLKDLADPAANEAWRQFRYDSVTGLVNEHLAPKAREYDKQVTAAVFPNWWNVRQEWHKWNLDGFLPMLYHTFYEEDTAWVVAQTAAALERLNHSRPVYAGLYLPDLSPPQLKEAIDVATANGAAGVSLFSLGSLRDGHLDVMRR